MNLHTKHTFIFFAPATAIAITLLSCAMLKPLATKAGDRLKDAIQDVDVKGIAQEHACGIYIDRGRQSAEDIFASEWPIFEPVFATKQSAAADLQWCTESLKALDVKIISKPHSTSSTSVCGVVAFGSKFEEMSTVKQAAVCEHELAHILGQRRMGCKPWLANYALVSGRLAAEGTAYALSDAVMARHGVSEADIAKQAASRAERFPDSYGLKHVVSSECVADYFGAIRRALRERTGV
jgi:hypothetical protein